MSFQDINMGIGGLSSYAGELERMAMLQRQQQLDFQSQYQNRQGSSQSLWCPLCSTYHQKSYECPHIQKPLIKVEKKEEKKQMFSFYGSMKDYVKRHGDIIFTVFFIMAADKWFFNGALKGALQRLVEKMISKADLHLDKPIVEQVK